MAKCFLIIFITLVFLSGCAGTGYNTQKGAGIGAGIGALAGQAIGHDTESTLIGMAAGTLVGAIAGNAVDQNVSNQKFCRQTTYGCPAPAYTAPEDEIPPGEWIVVPGKWMRGRWVPAHRVWVPVNP